MFEIFRRSDSDTSTGGERGRSRRVKMNGRSFACIAVTLCVHAIPTLAMPELNLVHVLFAHKLYAPEDYVEEEASLPRTLSYEYFTSAATNMSKNSNLNMYNLGVHLRETYGEFLGEKYEIMKMRTTEYVLSILSAQLVNAGLWPPSEKQVCIKDISWQPVPTEYLKLEEDTSLLGSLCPNFISQMDQVLRTTETRETLSQHRSLFDYLSHYTRRKIDTPSDVALLYASLETMIDRNQMLPYWANDVFPDGAMYNTTLLEYDLLSATSLQRQLNGGVLLGEIINNSLRYTTGDTPGECRMMLYSGDQRNIVGVLKNLDLWSPHIPNEAAALIFELYYDSDTDAHGMKINYYIGTDNTTIPLSLPNCTELCPLQVLINVTFDSIPQDPQSLCGWSVENSIETNGVVSSNHDGSSTLYNGKNLMFNLILYTLGCLVFAK